MPSRRHEDLVAGIVAAGMSTPEIPPTADEMVASRAAESSLVPPPPVDLLLEEVDAGGVPALWVRPAEASDDVVLVYLHGGGYIWMTPRTHLPAIGGLVRATGAACLAVDYRRAPEHRFPAAVEDLVAAYRWLLATGVQPEQIVLTGDSAGAGLVLGGMVALRDAGVELPAGGVCFSPWTDLTVSGPSADSADDPVVSGNALRMMASLYLGAADPTSPTASPLYADLAGLPPIQIHVGTRESLLDDSRRFARRAIAAGVVCELVEHAGVIHMWIVFDPDLPESVAAFQGAACFIEGVAGA
jgi:epsilon-lactone hydrolase